MAIDVYTYTNTTKVPIRKNQLCFGTYYCHFVDLEVTFSNSEKENSCDKLKLFNNLQSLIDIHLVCNTYIIYHHQFVYVISGNLFNSVQFNLVITIPY